MIKINVISSNINWIDYIRNPNNYIDKKVRKLNSSNKNFFKKKTFCSLLLSDDKEIKYLNKKFRNKNKTTDVLSFPFHTKLELKKMLRKKEEIYLGDIVINLNKIKGKKLSKNFKAEFDYLWIHGLVHLFGYDHKKEKDFLLMKKIEKTFINSVND